MRKAGQALPDRPTVPDERTRELRAKLILEEALETISALGFIVEVGGYNLSDKRVREGIEPISPDREPDLEGIADGCADIIVVTTGTLSACGISDDAVQREVDCNNLAKFQEICPHCHIENSKPNDKEGIPHERRCFMCGTTWVGGHHNEAGKWVKSSSHKPPRIAEVLAEQANAAEACAAKTRQMESATKQDGDPDCFGEEYMPSSKTCQSCPNPRRDRCLRAYVGA